MPFRQVTVDANGEMISPYNKGRKSRIIINNGTGTVFISQDQANVTTQGLPLAPGVVYSETITEGDEPDRALYGVSVAGSQDLRVVEGQASEPVP